MGQLAQEKAKRPTRTFGANTEKNPKEECKAVLTRGQKNAQEEGKAKQEDKSEERRTEKKEEDKEAEEEEKEVITACTHRIPRYTYTKPKPKASTRTYI